MQGNDEEIEIDLKEIFGLLIHWLWLIILCGIVAGAVGFLVSKYVVTPEYESTTTVYIMSEKNNGNLTYSDMQMGTQLTKDYAQLIKSRSVLEAVIEAAGLSDSYSAFASRVSVSSVSDTRIIAIKVVDTNPAMAQYLADEIRVTACQHIEDVMDFQAVKTNDVANLPKSPSSPNVRRWSMLGALLGAFLCAMILVIRYLLDDTIKTEEDVEKYLGVSTLAMIPIQDSNNKKNKKGNSKEKDDDKIYDRATYDKMMKKNEVKRQETEIKGQTTVIKEQTTGKEIG